MPLLLTSRMYSSMSGCKISSSSGSSTPARLANPLSSLTLQRLSAAPFTEPATFTKSLPSTLAHHSSSNLRHSPSSSRLGPLAPRFLVQALLRPTWCLSRTSSPSLLLSCCPLPPATLQPPLPARQHRKGPSLPIGSPTPPTAPLRLSQLPKHRGCPMLPPKPTGLVLLPTFEPLGRASSPPPGLFLLLFLGASSGVRNGHSPTLGLAHSRRSSSPRPWCSPHETPPAHPRSVLAFPHDRPPSTSPLASLGSPQLLLLLSQLFSSHPGSSQPCPWWSRLWDL